MANKRMFSMKIVDTDAFLDMPPTAQNLYFHLNMRADDDGFIGNAKRIMRDVRATDDDLKVLLAKRFLIEFEGQVFVIKHWWMHNTLQKDRYHETSYIDEKNMLSIKENKAYTIGNSLNNLEMHHFDNGMITECYQNDNADLGLDLNKDINNKLCANELFESLWKLYPTKKGKGKVSDSKKKELAKIGFDEIKRCIDRYLEDLSKDTWRKPQNGSTFFTSGYIDYLDKNYEQQDISISQNNNKNGRQG